MDETGDFSSIDLYKMEMRLEKEGRGGDDDDDDEDTL
jgi:hypothetical protein